MGGSGRLCAENPPATAERDNSNKALAVGMRGARDGLSSFEIFSLNYNIKHNVSRVS